MSDSLIILRGRAEMPDPAVRLKTECKSLNLSSLYCIGIIGMI